MGGTLSRLFGRYGKMQLIMKGLDDAGKTTILRRLNLSPIVETIPTIGFRPETMDHPTIQMISWDTGGRDKFRFIYDTFAPPVDGLIWVIDSSSRDRLGGEGNPYGSGSAHEELHRVLSGSRAVERMKHTPLLILANKQDLPNAMSPLEICERLGLNKLRGRQWMIQGCAATHSADGIIEGLNWLSETVGKSKLATHKTTAASSSSSVSSSNQGSDASPASAQPRDSIPPSIEEDPSADDLKPIPTRFARIASTDPVLTTTAAAVTTIPDGANPSSVNEETTDDAAASTSPPAPAA